MCNLDTGGGSAGEPDGASMSPRDRLRGKAILLVEDVRVIADYLADLLADMGCVVVGPFPDAQKAERALDDQRIDAGVLDQQLAMQTTSGLATALRRRGIPFLYVTGYSCDFIDPAFPAAPILEKPFSQRDFESALIRLLGDRSDDPPAEPPRH